MSPDQQADVDCSAHCLVVNWPLIFKVFVKKGICHITDLERRIVDTPGLKYMTSNTNDVMIIKSLTKH